MNKFFKILGIIFICLIALIGSIAGYVYLKSSEYSKTAVPYIKEKIPEISSWDPEISKKYMAPEVLANIKDDDLNKLMRWFSKLGALKNIEEPSFVNVSSNVTAEHGKQTIAVDRRDVVTQ